MVLSPVNSRILSAIAIISLFATLVIFFRDADDTLAPLDDLNAPSNPFANPFSDQQNAYYDSFQSPKSGLDAITQSTSPLLSSEKEEAKEEEKGKENDDGGDTFPAPSPEEIEMLENLAATYNDPNSNPSTNTVPDEPFSPSVTDKVAIIIEDRALNNLIPLILHFAAVLGPTWPVILYTSSELGANLSTNPSLSRWSHQIGLRMLPEMAAVGGRSTISRFLTSSWLWDDLAPATHVLLFQSDSMICANSPRSVDDFLEWDFVGAPVAEAYGHGYNGGLSLRNRQKVLDTVTRFDWDQDRNSPTLQFEDQWFYAKMQELSAEHEGAVRLPPVEIASQFAVETIWSEKPLGYHQPLRWQAERMPEIEEWCPEIKLALPVTS